MIEGDQREAVFYLPQRSGNEQFGSAIFAQLLTKGQFPGANRGIFSAGDSRKGNFCNRAGTDQTKSCAAKQVAQVGVLNVRASAQTKFITKQVAQVNGSPPLEDAALPWRERVERSGGRGMG